MPQAVGVVDGELGLGQLDGDGDARPPPDLDQELAASGRLRLAPGRRVPGRRVLPPDEELLLGAGEGDGRGQLGHLGAGQASADHHARALHEAAGLHPVLLAGQGEQVAHGVRDHRHAGAALTVEAGERVDPVHHAVARAQSAPELVEDDEVVPARLQAGVGQRVGDVDGPESIGPAGQQNRRLKVHLGVIDGGDVVDHGGVAAHRVGRRPGEGLPEPTALSQSDERGLQLLGDDPVALCVPAVQGDGAHLRRTLVDDGQQVSQDGYLPLRGEALVEHLQGAVEDGLLAVGGRRRAQDRQEGRDHGESAPVGVGEDLHGPAVIARPAQLLGRHDGLARVEDVEVAATAPQSDDLSPERFDEIDVVRLEVAEHQRHHSVAGQAQGHAPHAGGLAQARFAQDEAGGVGDQLGPLEPADRVAAQGGAGLNVPAQRHPDHGGAGADRERPQPAHLDGRAAPFPRGLDVGGRAPPGPQPAPCGRPPGTDGLGLVPFLAPAAPPGA